MQWEPKSVELHYAMNDVRNHLTFCGEDLAGLSFVKVEAGNAGCEDNIGDRAREIDVLEEKVQVLKDGIGI